MSVLVLGRVLDFAALLSTDLARPRNAQSRKQSICSVPAVGRKHSLDKRYDACAVENVKLRGIFFEHLCKGELLDGASPIIRRIKRNVSGCTVLLRWRLDGEKALCGLRGTSLRWP